jgi:hypothetical protein
LIQPYYAGIPGLPTNPRRSHYQPKGNRAGNMQVLICQVNKGLWEGLGFWLLLLGLGWVSALQFSFHFPFLQSAFASLISCNL